MDSKVMAIFFFIELAIHLNLTKLIGVCEVNFFVRNDFDRYFTTTKRRKKNFNKIGNVRKKNILEKSSLNRPLIIFPVLWG